MKILVGGAWRDDFLDYYRGPDEYRVQVLLWKNLERLEGLYFVRGKSLRLLWNYLREIGLRQVWRKVLSRAQERGRNEKYVACGIGHVLETPAHAAYKVGAPVVFLAPCHPACTDRIVLPPELLAPVEGQSLFPAPESAILCLAEPGKQESSDSWWSDLRGWSPHSGISLDPTLCLSVLTKAAESIRQTDWSNARRLSMGANRSTCERSQGKVEPARAGKKTGVLMGYGNYAKVVILPNISPYVRVSCIHELDPLQMPLDSNPAFVRDTSPVLRREEGYDVVLIAGYHHTHAPLAVAAVKRGACAVVEKPIVTDAVQLRTLLQALCESPGRLFCGFHKRYSPFNALALQDLNAGPGTAISYHCIIYEVPLPPMHWYRWPNSQSRLVSNGCHWIDHFLHLNGYCKPISWDVTLAANGTLNCTASLANGAFFTMVLTDQGSERIGMQEYVELRANGVTVKIENSSKYQSEDKDRIRRRRRASKVFSYQRMYSEIGQRIAAGSPGDSAKSVETSAGLVLRMEERLRELLRSQI